MAVGSEDDPFFPFKRAGKTHARTVPHAASPATVVVRSKTEQTVFAAGIWRTTCLLPAESTNAAESRLSAVEVRGYLRSLGLIEDIVIHAMKRRDFLREKDLKELGRGGEGAVYFLRGHVVKLVERPFVRMALREIAHMLVLNPAAPQGDAALGVRTRDDFPSLLWLYLLDDGGLSIGMRTFDEAAEEPGTTFEHRLRHGPPMKSGYVVRMLLNLSRSLADAHKTGIVHHDLKPANVYLPHNSTLRPIVFDFGQSLWRVPAWGRQWMQHEHNAPVWYNGTYRYMHASRRHAHNGALALLQNREPSARQREALNSYTPDFSDDVFAFARMLRDLAYSPYPCVSGDDDHALRALARRLLGLKQSAPHARQSTGIGRMLELFGKKQPAALQHDVPAMHDVVNALEMVLDNFR